MAQHQCCLFPPSLAKSKRLGLEGPLKSKLGLLMHEELVAAFLAKVQLVAFHLHSVSQISCSYLVYCSRLASISQRGPKVVELELDFAA
jgi:diaminopimelate decarboxylase